MARYTPEFLAAARQRYEDSKQSLVSLAFDLGVSDRELRRIARAEGWARRTEPPPRDLPAAFRLLDEAKALATQSAHSRDSGNPVSAAEANSEPPGLLGPRFRGDDAPESASAPNALPETPTPTLPLAGGGNLSAIERIEALVVKEIEAEEAARAQLGHKPRAATASERSARTLATLTQTLHALQRLRAGNLPEHETFNDDDMPSDIDAFRYDLARRIDAFVASRADAADADGDSDVKPLDRTG